MVATTFLATALFAGVAFSQNASYPQTNIQQVIDNTDLTLRNSWCTGQRTICGQLCGGQTETGQNRCDGTTLNYTCICSSNDSAPALQYYANTIPTLECVNLNGACMATNANDLAAQQQCNVTYDCGPQVNASEAAASSSESAAATTSSAAETSASQTASQTSATGAANSDSAATALRIGEKYGAGILSAGLLAVMGLVL